MLLSLVVRGKDMLRCYIVLLTTNFIGMIFDRMYRITEYSNINI
jgi:hypothetical protein